MEKKKNEYDYGFGELKNRWFQNLSNEIGNSSNILDITPIHGGNAGHEKCEVPSGYSIVYHPNSSVTSRMFHRTNTCSIVGMIPIEGDDEKIKNGIDIIKDYFKNDDKQIGHDCFGEHSDTKKWNPVIGNKENFVGFYKDDKTGNKYVVAHTSTPKLSSEFHDYVKNNIDGKNVQLLDFLCNDEKYRQLLDGSYRNHLALMYDITKGLAKIKTIEDLKSHSKYGLRRLMAQPHIHHTINSFDCVNYKDQPSLIYNNKSCLNKLYSKNDLKIQKHFFPQKDNDIFNAYHIVLGGHNKKVLVLSKKRDDKNRGMVSFPIFTGKSNETEEKSKYVCNDPNILWHLNEINKSRTSIKRHLKNMKKIGFNPDDYQKNRLMPIVIKCVGQK